MKQVQVNEKIVEYAEDLKKESMIIIKDIYLPFFGKCVGPGPITNDNGKIRARCEIINNHRKDDGTPYILGDMTYGNGLMNINIDLEQRQLYGTCVRAWVGGLVEKINFTYTIEEIDSHYDEIFAGYSINIYCS